MHAILRIENYMHVASKRFIRLCWIRYFCCNHTVVITTKHIIYFTVTPIHKVDRYSLYAIEQAWMPQKISQKKPQKVFRRNNWKNISMFVMMIIFLLISQCLIEVDFRNCFIIITMMIERNPLINLFLLVFIMHYIFSIWWHKKSRSLFFIIFYGRSPYLFTHSSSNMNALNNL